jgi:hypothetical protein
MPDVNIERGGIFQVGNVVSIEPGSYIPEARAGVRLENMYLITESGPENLSQYPTVRYTNGSRVVADGGDVCRMSTGAAVPIIAVVPKDSYVSNICTCA